MSVSGFIRNNIEKILQEWEEHAYAIQPEIGSMDKVELRDHAEKILLAIANGIDRNKNIHYREEQSRGLHPLLGKALRSSVEHGITRHGFGFNINDVLSEYRALRSSVMRLWAGSEQGDSDTVEIALFNEELDGVIMTAVEAFAAETDKQRRLLEKVITTSRDHCYLLSRDGRFIYANTSLLNDLNIKNSALMGMTHHDLSLLASETLHHEAMQVIATGEERSGEVMYSLPSGEDKIYEYIYAPILDNQETIEGVAALERDTSERKKTVDLLMEREKRLRLATDAARLGVLEWEPQNDRSIWHNPRMFEIFGLSPQDQPLDRERLEGEVLHPEHLPRFRQEIMESMQNRTPFTGKYQIRRLNDGQWRWIEYLGKFEYDDSGEVIRLLSVLSDITERKRNAEALAAANSELQAFTYSASHDLKSPLRAMTALSELLHKKYNDVLDDKGQDLLRRIISGTHKMREIIDNLFMLSHVSQQEIVRTELDISAIAAEIIAEIQTAEPTRAVDVHIQKCPIVLGDVHLMKIALTNLLGNAWKYTGKTADPVIEIGCLQRAHETILFVRDNGAGFPAERAEEVFRPFRRLHSESEFQGTGIGLATVQRIINRHGGRIWAESQPGSGTTFSFTLDYTAGEGRI